MLCHTLRVAEYHEAFGRHNLCGSLSEDTIFRVKRGRMWVEGSQEKVDVWSKGPIVLIPGLFNL
jgi:hypothetical protein